MVTITESKGSPLPSSVLDDITIRVCGQQIWLGCNNKKMTVDKSCWRRNKLPVVFHECKEHGAKVVSKKLERWVRDDAALMFKERKMHNYVVYAKYVQDTVLMDAMHGDVKSLVDNGFTHDDFCGFETWMLNVLSELVKTDTTVIDMKPENIGYYDDGDKKIYRLLDIDLIGPPGIIFDVYPSFGLGVFNTKYADEDAKRIHRMMTLCAIGLTMIGILLAVHEIELPIDFYYFTGDPYAQNTETGIKHRALERTEILAPYVYLFRSCKYNWLKLVLETPRSYSQIPPIQTKPQCGQ